MIIRRFSETYLSANCYIVLSDPVEGALVVDPGAGSAAAVKSALTEYNTHVAGVLLTHGHADHVWDAAEVAGEAPVWIPRDDEYRLADPSLGGLHPASLIEAIAGHAWKRPENVVTLDPGQTFSVGGVELNVCAAPGHTEGSSLYLWKGAMSSGAGILPDMSDGRTFAFSGDVLFRDGVGRTDLPGGSDEAMMTSLGRIATEVDSVTTLFPGHGGATTLARELRSRYVRHYLRRG